MSEPTVDNGLAEVSRRETFPRFYRVIEKPFPGEAAVRPPSPRDPHTNCYIVIGNHDSYVSIVEMVHALYSFFAPRYRTYISEWIIPDAINVVIDEFARDAMVDLMMRVKQTHPGTRYIVMATEFITKMAPLGIKLTNTFNYFALRDNRRDVLQYLRLSAGLQSITPYYLARYRGFVAALPVVDLVLCAHQAVADTMGLLARDGVRPNRPALTLHPEISAVRLSADPRLYLRPVGVVMTGTLTRYRHNIGRKLVQAFKLANINRPVYQHVPFEPSSGLRLTTRGVYLGYDRDVIPEKGAEMAYLYNLNPPQRRNWAYSSPMRIQRALLMGQIPVVTRKFGDHPIEETAFLWDAKARSAQTLWTNATVGRNELVARHVATVASYNDKAVRNNAAIDVALAEF